jgi:hypothetical protein
MRLRLFRSLLLAAFGVLLVAPDAHAVLMRVTHNIDGKKTETPTRTFYEQRSANPNVDFSLSYAQMSALYAIGGTVEVYHKISDEDYEESYVYTMNVGDTNLDSPTTYVFPDVDFDGVWRYLIEDPAETEDGARYPTATHALVEQFDEAVDYGWVEYYRIDETGVTLIAYVECTQSCGTDDAVKEYLEQIRGDGRLAIFPLDETLSIYHEDEFFDEDFEQDVKWWQRTEMHGFGTLQIGNESVEVGAFLNDVNWQEPGETDPNTVIDFESAYSIFGTDGTWLQFNVAEDPDLEEIPFKGEVEIMDIELWRVTPASSVAVERDEAVPAGFTLHAPYPNPAAGRATLSYALHITTEITLSVYDALGRQVTVLAEGVQAPGEYAAEFDGSSLPSGVYLVRLAAGAQQATKLVVLHR